jgi:hypothetical protein
MHDFVTHIDGCAEEFQGTVNDFDSAINTGTKAAWVGENGLHDSISLITMRINIGKL